MPELPKYAEVPDDYPYAPVRGAVSGYQPKVLLTSSLDGKYYSPGNAPNERWHDWNYSTTLVSAMVEKCLESKLGKRAHMSETEIISQYYKRALAAGGRYGTEDQLRWTFTKVAKALAWPLPEDCHPTVSGTLTEKNALAATRTRAEE
jgi:hypothetical protein